VNDSLRQSLNEKGFQWWVILLLTIISYLLTFIYYRENRGMVDPVDGLVTAFLLLPILLVGLFLF
jgi:hypothetical protein